MFSLTKMVLDTALVHVESSLESFINSGSSVDCVEQTQLERGGSESQERRRELTLSVALGVDGRDNGGRMASRAKDAIRREMETGTVCLLYFIEVL